MNRHPSDKVVWWRMGRNAARLHGKEKALEMAELIKVAGIRNLFLSGVRGEPRPKLRRPID